MHIISLKSDNIKRLTAIEIVPDPDAAIVTIGGKNGAGKSSVLDSIAYALGGDKLVPPEPIRKGETTATIEVDLGEYLVVRKFKRDKIETSTQNKVLAHTFGPIKSTLTVKSKDGAIFPSPQAMLDRLIGKLTFDPMDFAQAKPKDQNEILRKITNLDFTIVDEQRRTAFQRRASFKKQLDERVAQHKALNHYPEAPAEPIPLSTVSDELAAAEKLRRAAEDADQQVRSLTAQVATLETRCQNGYDTIKELQRKLTAAQAQSGLEEGNFQAAVKLLAERQRQAATARAAVPDVESVQQRLKEIEATNAQVAVNQLYAARQAEVTDLEGKVETEQAAIDQIDTQKRQTLESATFPVEGLGLNDDGVTLHGIPFEQCSSHEQLRVSVAMGLALNPSLKVLLVRNGNLLDSASRRMLAEAATAAGSQVWMELVTESRDGVSVLIEDGHLA